MAQYRFTISGDRWASDYVVEATNWATGVARAVREWRKKEGKGSRTLQLNVKGHKVNGLKTPIDNA